MKLPISSRLLTCCYFINWGDRVADIGCDHGYLAIYLLQKGIARSVIASDVNENPLMNAVRNAEKYGVRDRIEFCLSNGAQSIPRDFDTLVCAGMGADTMISILDAAPWLKDRKYRLILQCQSRRPELRKYLYAQGYRITREHLAQDGKFIYPVTEVVYDPADPLTPGGYHITPALLRSGEALLPAFYNRLVNGIRTTVEGLSRSDSEKHEEYRAILDELEQMKDLCHSVNPRFNGVYKMEYMEYEDADVDVFQYLLFLRDGAVRSAISPNFCNPSGCHQDPGYMYLSMSAGDERYNELYTGTYTLENGQLHFSIHCEGRLFEEGMGRFVTDAQGPYPNHYLAIRVHNYEFGTNSYRCYRYDSFKKEDEGC